MREFHHAPLAILFILAFSLAFARSRFAAVGFLNAVAWFFTSIITFSASAMANTSVAQS